MSQPLDLSHRLAGIHPSPTLAISARAATLKSAGREIISLSLGEPDFDTPDPIKHAAIVAMEKGYTKYTAVEGILSLRQAIRAKFARDNQVHYQPDQILVSCGGKQCFFNLVQALLNPGDEVIIPAPFWVSYPDIVSLAGGTPIVISAPIEQHFKITPQQLEAALTPKTRLFVLNSPANPTGMAYTHQELSALGQILIHYPHVLIATDDIYEHILWRTEPFSNILMTCPELYERTMILHGVSKTYAMTGWRIGFSAGPKALIQAMGIIQSQSTSNACSIAQYAAQAALEGDQQCVKTMVEAFKERHDFLVHGLNQLPGVQCCASDGAFYAFPKIQAVIDAGIFPSLTDPNRPVANDIELADYLLEKAEVATVPGSAFGAPGYLRLSFATSLAHLDSALSRLRSILRSPS